MRLPLSVELPVQAEKSPDSKLSAEIISAAPEGRTGVLVPVTAKVGLIVGATFVGDGGRFVTDAWVVVGDEAGMLVDVRLATGEETGDVGLEDMEVRDDAGMAVGVRVKVAGSAVDVAVGGSGVKVRVAVRVAVGTAVCVLAGVGFGPVAPTQFPVPESVKVCPAIGTNCQS